MHGARQNGWIFSCQRKLGFCLAESNIGCVLPAVVLLIAFIASCGSMGHCTEIRTLKEFAARFTIFPMEAV